MLNKLFHWLKGESRASAFAALTLLGASSLALPGATEASPRRVFECRNISGAPTTVLINSKGEERQMIRWVSNVIPGYPPERRCPEVTGRMNVHFSGGSQYVTYGRMNNENVICITDEQGNDCLPNGLVYTLKRGQDPKTTLEDLFQINNPNVTRGPLREPPCPTYVNIAAIVAGETLFAEEVCPPRPDRTQADGLNELEIN